MSTWTYPTSTLWMHYCDVFNLLGQMPINGSPHDADCAIALAFGRNSIPDNDFPEIRGFYNIFKQDIETIDHIKPPYFSGFDSGQPNHRIAQIAEVCIVSYDIPLITQWEISMSLYKQRGAAWVQDRFAHQELFCLWPPVGRSAYRTLEVLEDAFKITQEKKWKRPLLLAHDYHMPRVAMLARHFWPEFIIGFPAITRAFDAKSVQSQCASYSKWRMYELKGRMHHLLCGWCFGYFQWGRF